MSLNKHKKSLINSQKAQNSNIFIEELNKKSIITESSELNLQDIVLDLGREQRSGLQEVIYGAGKTPKQIVTAFKAMLEKTGKALATRCSDKALKELKKNIPSVKINSEAHIAWEIDSFQNKNSNKFTGKVAVVTAGTSDIPVAEEASITLEFVGIIVERYYDTGVAGIHRLLRRLNKIQEADVIIVAAGMEGALPSVLGGLVPVPIIALPTSIGYGASFNGLAALLAMLNSCAHGIVVVNIDNGFGAAAAAIRILRGKSK